MTEHMDVLDSPQAIRRHLRRAISPEHFESHGVRFVLCGQHNEVLLHGHLGHVPVDASPADCADAMSVFTQALAACAGCGLLIALTRPGPATLLAADRRWFQVAHHVCAEHEVRLLGVHVVTPRGQRQLLLDDVL